MENDDRPVGRILSRREALALLGIGGAAALLGPRAFGQPGPPPDGPRGGPGRGRGPGGPGGPGRGGAFVANGCFAKPELTEGPFFVDEKLNRSDIRSDPQSKIVQPGALLDLTFKVYGFADGCGPLPNAMVDVWHCDAMGRYSDVRENGTLGQKFLRGYQMTDKDGLARFTTIYPGWYRGRAVHLHFKIRTQKANRNYEFTSQLFFDDALSDKVFPQAPYAANGRLEMRNAQDGIFRDGGSHLLITPTAKDAGYTATFEVGLQV